MLTPNDIGKLKRGDRVKVGNRFGTVIDPHEPQWIDHKTKAQMHVLQGADIRFDDDHSNTYIHCAEIEIIIIDLQLIERAKNPREGDVFTSKFNQKLTVTSHADGVVNYTLSNHAEPGDILNEEHRSATIEEWHKLVPRTLDMGATFIPVGGLSAPTLSVAHKEPHLIGKHITVVYEIEDPTAWRATNPLHYAHNGLKALTVSVSDVIDTRDNFRTALETIADNDPFDSAAIARSALDAEDAAIAAAVRQPPATDPRTSAATPAG
jgi:hypothetical protein